MENNLAILKYILNEIDYFTNVRHQMPLSGTVSNQSKQIIGMINRKHFQCFDCCYITKYSTFVIDFINFENGVNNMFSLEIGKTQLGYFTEGKYEVIRELLEIDTVKNINKTIVMLNDDLCLTL